MKHMSYQIFEIAEKNLPNLEKSWKIDSSQSLSIRQQINISKRLFLAFNKDCIDNSKKWFVIFDDTILTRTILETFIKRIKEILNS